MDNEIKQRLIAKAKEGMSNAYSIVFDFKVGAAVLTNNGNIYQGCNTESVISGLGLCAERSSIYHAVAHGEYIFEAIAIVSKLEEPIKPCGMCRQLIGEFNQLSESNIKIIMVGSKGKIIESTINDMLPAIHGPKTLNLDLEEYCK
ncbi:MAG TPA: cytidine deaminase [Victivallales bacterium]|nr:cytidine deaminase [Victivallales bacterium]